MVLVMCAELVFGAIRDRQAITINRPSEVRIETSWKELTDRCTITVPRNVRFFNKYKVKEVFKPGDPVTVRLGYNGVLSEEFGGYVTSVSADMPIVIKCEDEMWKLKQLPVSFSAKGTTLENLLKSICPGYSVDTLEGVNLGGIRLVKTSVAKVLDKLKDEFGLYSYMKGKQLVCGKYYADDTTIKPVKFNMERNVVDNNLQYRNRDEVVLQIKGVSMLSGGKKLEYETGTPGGDRLELSYYNIKVMADLIKLVDADYLKRKSEGFDGSFTAFGTPRVQHGWKVDLSSTLYPDRTGMYYIEAVEKTFGSDGYRQVIKLGDKVA